MCHSFTVCQKADAVVDFNSFPPERFEDVAHFFFNKKPARWKMWAHLAWLFVICLISHENFASTKIWNHVFCFLYNYYISYFLVILVYWLFGSQLCKSKTKYWYIPNSIITYLWDKGPQNVWIVPLQSPDGFWVIFLLSMVSSCNRVHGNT